MGLLTKEQENEIMDASFQCHNDPLKFVESFIKWDEVKGSDGPDKWQKTFLAKLGDELTSGIGLNEAVQMAIASGHGIGKSATVAWLILWAMTTRPNLSGVITANTSTQLTTKTWRELAVWHNRLINKHWFKWTATKFYAVQYPETWFVSAIPWTKERSEAFAGLHSEYVMVIFDEASAIDDMIWEVTEGAMTTPGAMWFAFGNPTRNTGRFRECFGKLKNRWITTQVDSREAKMVNKAQVNTWIEDYGDDSDFVRVRVKGQFPRSGSAQLISGEVVEHAMKRDINSLDMLGMPKILGVDVARYGDDEICLTMRQGMKAFPSDRYRELDLMTTADIVARKIDLHKIDKCFVDQTGMGAGVVDRLHQLGYREIVVGVDFGSKSGNPICYNKRMEIWWSMRDWLATADIPDEQELYDDLIAPEYGYRNDGKVMQLEKKEDIKKRLGRSPDNGDSLALTFSYPVNIDNRMGGYSGKRMEEENNIRLY